MGIKFSFKCTLKEVIEVSRAEAIKLLPRLDGNNPLHGKLHKAISEALSDPNLKTIRFVKTQRIKQRQPL